MMSTDDHLVIRRMRPDDLGRVLAIERLSYLTPWTRSNFSYELSSSRISRLWAAEMADAIAGYVATWMLVPEVHVTNIAVDPAYRRMGIGRRLLQTVFDAAESEGAKVITLEVRDNNSAARKLYHQFGFELKGIRRNYYPAEKADALIMSRIIR